MEEPASGGSAMMMRARHVVRAVRAIPRALGGEAVRARAAGGYARARSNAASRLARVGEARAARVPAVPTDALELSVSGLRRDDLEGDRDLELLKGLSYAILNKTRLSYIYAFNEGS